jgi:hypothetical protein
MLHLRLGFRRINLGTQTEVSPSRFLNRQVPDLKHVTDSILLDAFDGDVGNDLSMLFGIEFRGLRPGRVPCRPWKSSLD